MNISQKSNLAVQQNVIGKVLIALLRLIAIGILARKIAPENFGLIALVMPIITFVELISDSGLSMSSIQNERFDHNNASIYYYINISIAIVLGLIFILAFLVISNFIEIERYKFPLIIFISAAIFQSFSIQYKAILIRNIQFNKILLSEVVGGSLSTIISCVVILINNDLEIISLTIFYALDILLKSFFFIQLSTWRPLGLREIDWKQRKLRFGIAILYSRLLQFANRNLDSFLVASYLGERSLGFYKNAYNLASLPNRHILTGVNRVLSSSLSRLQSNKNEFSILFFEWVNALFHLYSVIFSIMFIWSDELIDIYLGNGWEESKIILKLLLPAIYISIINFFVDWILIPMGLDKQIKQNSIFTLTVSIIGILIGIQFGMTGLCFSILISSIITQIFVFKNGDVLSLVTNRTRIIRIYIKNILFYFLIPVVMNILISSHLLLTIILILSMATNKDIINRFKIFEKCQTKY